MYKRAIIDSQGQEESSCDVENSLNSLLWNGRGLNMCFSHGGQYDISPLKMQKTEQSWGGLGTHCKAALEPFVGIQNMVEL